MYFRLLFLSVTMLFFSCTPGNTPDTKNNEYPFFGMALEGQPTPEKLDFIKSETGISPSIVVFFIQWPSPESSGYIFPSSTLDAVWERGGIPCITWEPMYYKGKTEIMISGKDILAGRYNEYIKWFSEKISAWGKPVLIRFAHEMNLARYHWGTDKTGYGPQSPDIYRRMYQYVVNIFRSSGCNNVFWVFCPNAESVPGKSYDPDASWNQAKNYYPGDSYIHILGMDGYNWGTTMTVEKHGWQSAWKSFSEVFYSLYMELRSISHGKPVMVFETATATEGGSKAQWINEALKVSNDWGLKGLVWFQVNKEIDWRINSHINEAIQIKIRHKKCSSQDWILSLSDKPQRSK